VTPTLAALLQRQRDSLAERAPAAFAALAAAPLQVQAEADHVLLCSDFVLRAFITLPSLLPQLLAENALQQARSLSDYQARVELVLAATGHDLPACQRALRQLRQLEMVRLAWRDLCGAATVEQTLLETSWLAEALIARATAWARQSCAIRHGLPAGSDADLVVLGMGKLGGGELNFSSDVDLVLLYASGEGTNGPLPLSREEFFLQQARVLIRLLDERTADGFVFRVDLRLRPYGDSGPLVCSFAAFEDYLQSAGRDWERYAYVKARALTGQALFAPVQAHVLRPFVYRRYLDFGVFDSLREMRGLIAREVVRRDLADHVKLGPGGIREIEFAAQSLQLIRGGQDALLREVSLLAVLPRLRGVKLLGDAAVTSLHEAYLFLRKLENRLQMLDDQQTHSLPVEALAIERIASAMGFAGEAELRAELEQQRGRVIACVGAVALPTQSAATPLLLELLALWEQHRDEQALLAALQSRAVPEAAQLLPQLVELPQAPRLRRLDAIGRRRLAALLECLLTQLPAVQAPLLLRRLLSIIEAIGQRSAYFSLLLENSGARQRLLTVCAQGDYLAARIAAHPLLLDELLDAEVLQQLPLRATLQADLNARLAEVAGDEPDRQVEALYRFQRAALFRVALADLIGGLPLMQVSDRLTEIAELITESAMQMAWQQMVERFGTPSCCDTPNSCDTPGGALRAVRVAAIGYGKLGGRELGYASDLDLVFLHDSMGEQQQTTGAAPVDNQLFFLRWAQRLLHLLTVHTGAGRLYEVDMRLRPSGNGGLLVTRIEAFAEYQYGEAWTWEHQALLHARAVAGDPLLRQRIEALRLDVLQNAVHREDLRQRVQDMRERMRRELSAAKAGQFDLKQDRGGIADIEFLAQYWALRWAQQYPAVVLYADTIRELETLASGALVAQETVDILVQAYQAYRAVLHHRSLDGLGGVVEADRFVDQRAAVTAIWNAAMTSGDVL